MSVINQMLQDLEKRRAGATEAAAMPNQVRPLPAARDTASRSLLVGIGLAALFLLCQVVWWWSKSPPRTPAPAAQSQPAPVEAPVAVEPPAAQARPQAAPFATPAAALPPTATVKTVPDKLAHIEKKLPPRPAPVLAAPPPAVSLNKIPAPAPKMPPPVANKAPAPAPVPTVTAMADAPVSTELPARSELLPKPRTDFAQGSIDKQARPVSPRERADAEYRRATAALSQGRAEEAEESLRAALAEDATFDAARQALVGVLVEQKRVDEAKKVLQDYLNSRPNHLGFAMLLARLQLDRGDGGGAVTTMQRTLPYAGDNADFLGFSAAVLQRAGHHAEAADQYRAALRIKPDAPVWWMGLGISLQASDHNTDALDAYKRALSSGSLSPELQAFVEQKIKQLTP
jgi:MSHA biogenesis protein MshN